MRAMAPGADEAFDFDMAAATLQANSTDVHMLLKLLVKQLRDVLGKRLTFERAGGRLRKSDDIKSVELSMGDDVLRAEADGATVRCTIGHSSGGIRIRSEQVPMDEWLKRLLKALQAEAQHSESARVALENIVIGGSP
jgi:hypothetical protein